MVNKIAFRQLPQQVRVEVIRTLFFYDEVSVFFYNGEYHVETSVGLSASYPDDFAYLAKFRQTTVIEAAHQLVMKAEDTVNLFWSQFTDQEKEAFNSLTDKMYAKCAENLENRYRLCDTLEDL